MFGLQSNVGFVCGFYHLANQKEGNGNFDIVFALFRRDKCLHPEYFIMRDQCSVVVKGTYSNDSWVIWHDRRLVFLDARVILDP